MHTYNPSSWKIGAGGHLQLHSELEASLGYVRAMSPIKKMHFKIIYVLSNTHSN